MAKNDNVDQQNEVGPAPEAVNVDGDEVILRTTGMISAFSGEGFPTVLKAGTKMTKAEAEEAFKAAERTPDLEIEEVTKL